MKIRHCFGWQRLNDRLVQHDEAIHWRNKLLHAIKTNSLQDIHFLIAFPPVDLNSPNLPYSLFDTLANYGTVDAFQILLPFLLRDCKNSGPTTSFGGFLDTCCSKGLVDFVKILISDGRINVASTGMFYGMNAGPENNTPGCNKSALLKAIEAGDFPIVEVLANDDRFDVNTRYQLPSDLHYVGLSPFSIACLRGHYEVVRILAPDERISVNDKDTGFSLAAREGFLDIVELVADYLIIDLHGPLCNAATSGHTAIIECLLDQTPSRLGSLDLHDALKLASMYGHVEIVKTLLHDIRCDCTLENHRALVIAAEFGFPEIIRLILSEGQELNRKKTIFIPPRGSPSFRLTGLRSFQCPIELEDPDTPMIDETLPRSPDPESEEPRTLRSKYIWEPDSDDELSMVVEDAFEAERNEENRKKRKREKDLLFGCNPNKKPKTENSGSAALMVPAHGSGALIALAGQGQARGSAALVGDTPDGPHCSTNLYPRRFFIRDYVRAVEKSIISFQWGTFKELIQFKYFTVDDIWNQTSGVLTPVMKKELIWLKVYRYIWLAVIQERAGEVQEQGLQSVQGIQGVQGQNYGNGLGALPGDVLVYMLEFFGIWREESCPVFKHERNPISTFWTSAWYENYFEELGDDPWGDVHYD